MIDIFKKTIKKIKKGFDDKINQKQEINTEYVNKKIIFDPNSIVLPLKLITGKNIKIIDKLDFNKKILNYDKSKFPYIVLKGLFNGNEGDLISYKNKKCPFYSKNKIPIADYLNYKIIESFDIINEMIKNEILNIGNRTIDISNIIFKITSLIIGKIILGINDNNQIDTLKLSYTTILNDLGDRPQLYSVFNYILKKSDNEKNVDIIKKMDDIDNIFKILINNKDNFLINNLLKYNNKKEILNFLKFIFFAGFETTSNQLIFIIYMLSTNDIWQNQILEEINEIDDYYCLGKAKFLNSFIYETLRVHPIVNTSTREDEKSIYIFNTTKMNSKKDNEFNPYRYINQIPEIYTFQAGERQCIGKRISLVEMQLFVIHLIKNYKINLANKPIIRYNITKYIYPNLKINVEKRNINNIYNIKKPSNDIVKNIEVIYNGNKYNLSEYIFKHPGGKHIIASLNKMDMTEEFNSKHLNVDYILKILDKYKNYSPDKDIFNIYNIESLNYSIIDDKYKLVYIKLNKNILVNNLLKIGNTLVLHQKNNYESKCFSISNINYKECTICLFTKDFKNGIFNKNNNHIINNYVVSIISSIYSNIKDNDLLISIGSGIAPFISYNNCKKIAGFRGDYLNKFKTLNINNIILANSLNGIYIYQYLNKINFTSYNNIYICGNYQFIKKIKNNYCKNVKYDLW